MTFASSRGGSFSLSRRHLMMAAAAGLLAASGLSTVARSRQATPEDLTGVMPLPLTGARLAAFEAYVATTLAELGVPGAAVAVVQDGEVVFLQGFGVREAERQEPVNADTLLRIGSVTKSFSSLLLATVVDTGRISWETLLTDLLPDLALADPELTARLTVADAFCACTGLPRRDWEIVFQSAVLTPELLIAGMSQLPLTAPYGETFQYNNQLVAAGGFAAAVAAGGVPDDLGHAYEIALRERVLNPIGMEHSTLAITDVVSNGDYAKPHAADITGAVRPLPLLEDDNWIAAVNPTGGLWSSAREMARYVQTQLARGVAPNGGRVVSAENLERTWQPGVAMPAAPEGTPSALAHVAEHYALGWATGSYLGQRLVGHSGGTLGFGSLLTMLPEANLGIVTLTNALPDGAGFNTLVTFRLLELLFDQPAEIDTALAPGLAVVAEMRSELLARLGEVDPAAVGPYLGRYANPDLGEAALLWQEERFLFSIGGFNSELRPELDEAGAVVRYLPVNPPFGSIPPQFAVTLPESGREPALMMTFHDPGEPELNYLFTSAATTA